MTTKRNRADSASSAVKAMLNAAKDTIQVPAHVKLRDGDMVFWEGVVRARARDEWTETDLVVAGQLARCLHDIEDEQAPLTLGKALGITIVDWGIVEPNAPQPQDVALLTGASRAQQPRSITALALSTCCECGTPR